MPSAEYQREWRKRNPESFREYNRKWREANPEKKREASRAWADKHRQRKREESLFRRYGLTLEDFDKLLASQERSCAACRTDTPKGQWHVDHDHATDRVRGILCAACNTLLGKIEKSPDRMQALYAYIERTT